MRVVVIVFALVLSFPAFAQGKFFSTPSRGGAEGARQNAQLTTINGEFERMNACTGAGAVYAPTHPDANAGGCVTAIAERSMTGGLAVQGDATVQGHLNANGGLDVNGNTAVGGNLTVSGQIDVTGSIKISGGSAPCNSGRAGSLRYNSSAQQIEFCNGTAWSSLGDGASGGGSTSGGGGANCGPSLSGTCGNSSTYSHGQTWTVQGSCNASCPCGTCYGSYIVYHCQCYNGSRNLTGTGTGASCSVPQAGGCGDAGDW